MFTYAETMCQALKILVPRARALSVRLFLHYKTTFADSLQRTPLAILRIQTVHRTQIMVYKKLRKWPKLMGNTLPPVL